MFYEDVFRELDRRRIRYVVVGGVALVLHGVVRLTVDLDLIVQLERANLLAFVEAIDALGYRPRVPVPAREFVEPENRQRWKREKGMTVFSLFHPTDHGKLIDIFVDEPIPFQEIDQAKIMVKAADLSIPVISIPHLKRLKTIAGRAQDLADIEALEAIERMGGAS
ncbi:MAG: nucleotidyl transferase AbiEii/AbiGii toxin family protein [Nitrospirota bacterium]